MTNSEPERSHDARTRTTDGFHWKGLLRENWYRDIWLMTITIATMAVLIIGWIEITSLVRKEERSRRSVIIFTCQQQNERHDKLLIYISGLTKANARRPGGPVLSPKERARQVNGFVSAIAPKFRDCEKRADQLINAHRASRK